MHDKKCFQVVCWLQFNHFWSVFLCKTPCVRHLLSTLLNRRYAGNYDRRRCHANVVLSTTPSNNSSSRGITLLKYIVTTCRLICPKATNKSVMVNLNQACTRWVKLCLVQPLVGIQLYVCTAAAVDPVEKKGATITWDHALFLLSRTYVSIQGGRNGERGGERCYLDQQDNGRWQTRTRQWNLLGALDVW